MKETEREKRAAEIFLPPTDVVSEELRAKRKVLMKDKLMSQTGAVRASCSAASACDPACHSHSIAMTIIVMPTPGGGDKPVLVTNRTPLLCDASRCREDLGFALPSASARPCTHALTHTRSEIVGCRFCSFLAK